MYVAHRRNSHYFKNGEKTQSEAIIKGVAAWAIDRETLTELRLTGVDFVCVHIKEPDDFFITDRKKFEDSTLAQPKDYTNIGRGGSDQAYLPIQHMHYVMGRQIFR